MPYSSFGPPDSERGRNRGLESMQAPDRVRARRKDRLRASRDGNDRRSSGGAHTSSRTRSVGARERLSTRQPLVEDRSTEAERVRVGCSSLRAAGWAAGREGGAIEDTLTPVEPTPFEPTPYEIQTPLGLASRLRPTPTLAGRSLCGAERRSRRSQRFLTCVNNSIAGGR